MISTKNKQKRKISEFKPPRRYSCDLAEETGIHIGDGSLGIYHSKNKTTKHAYTYCGHVIDDMAFSRYVKSLITKLYGLSSPYEQILTNTIILCYSNKLLVRYKNRLGLPLGKKGNITIPNWILRNKSYANSCVRGIFATDGCLHFQKKYREIPYYPQISISSISKPLIEQIIQILNSQGIKSTISRNCTIGTRHPNMVWVLYVYGVKNLEKFVSAVGFLNPKHAALHDVWLKNGKKVPLGRFELPAST
tara:strand:- start:1052 stop:1798 length:747 start_codon:yes stop_codon:yes gene_type:complete